MLALAALALSSAHAAPDKAAICHYDATTASYSVIEVSQRAVAQHFAQHGDSFPAAGYADADGDGYGDPASGAYGCPDVATVDNADDCDDSDAAINPGAGETPYDGVDNDCDPSTADDDLDGDGFGDAEDCDDGDAAVSPAAAEACGNGLDDDCDGSADEGCDVACPCFTAEDIDMAWEQVTFMFENTSSESSCSDDAVGTSSTTALDFSRYSIGYSANNGVWGYESTDAWFTVTVDTSSSEAGGWCNDSWEAEWYEPGNIVASDYSFWPVDNAEGEACQQLLRTWIDAHAMTCQ